MWARGRHIPLRTGLAAILVAMAVYQYFGYRADNRVFDRIARQVCAGRSGDRERLEALAEWTHTDIAPRRSIPAVPAPKSVRIAEKLFTSFPRRALAGRVHCGSATNLFLAVSAQVGLECRAVCLHHTANMTGEPPSHVVVECRIDGRWVVADPVFGVLYELPNGQLVQVEELKADPGLVEAQTPDDYSMEYYSFQHVTRMNWNAVPVVLPLAYRLVEAVKGESVDEVRLPAIRRRPRLQLMLLFFVSGVVLQVAPPLVARRRARRATEVRTQA